MITPKVCFFVGLKRRAYKDHSDPESILKICSFFVVLCVCVRSVCVFVCLKKASRSFFLLDLLTVFGPKFWSRPPQPRKQRWTPTRWMWMTVGHPKVDEALNMAMIEALFAGGGVAFSGGVPLNSIKFL